MFVGRGAEIDFLYKRIMFFFSLVCWLSSHLVARLKQFCRHQARIGCHVHVKLKILTVEEATPLSTVFFPSSKLSNHFVIGNVCSNFKENFIKYQCE